MIDPKNYLNYLMKKGVSFFSGVPDSLLKDFCACISSTVPDSNHVITSNEGAAIGLAIGRYLGKCELPLVYLQNSGLGNAVNPLLSLASNKVYGIPMLVMIGWRGEPGIKDEPQHIHQGEVMLDMLDAMNVPSFILSDNLEELKEQTNNAIAKSIEISAPVALIARKGMFNKFDLSPVINNKVLQREEAIILATNSIEEDSIVISTTGMASRELYEHRAKKQMGHHRDFLTVGGMGHASQIALGLAMSQPTKTIYCFDGDGAALMHMGSLAISGQSKCANFIHVLFNNGVHGSVGGQPTVGFEIDFCKIASACGYGYSISTSSAEEFTDAIKIAQKNSNPSFIEIQTLPNNREDIGRPTSTPRENKQDLIKYIKSS
jgi:phosphonopyruvate decarboxylase